MSGPAPARRFPIDQLIDVERYNNFEIARQLDVSVQSVIRYKTHGIPEHSADRVATRMGLHPAVVWMDYYTLEESCNA